ncbi:helix-turn-helix domain-containing protein [Pseudarthrobacter phenanthrenivorans]|uniref:Excisionase n=1 Tax=Pseudarthrobacter phenanthrenivorans TaxID=361575 RepID=A0A0B4DHY8_PSEPS|nr:helix-turn-helix domain-containing protein [Pseudarthrobacter phenanthrenivorans]KIC66306.1 excisionase [Pseudarthrobacter phenanthrenivorans]
MTTENTPKRRFLTFSQVAEELNVNAPTVRALLAGGDLRGNQIGGRGLWRIGVQDLEDYIEKTYRDTAERIASGAVLEEDTAP